jgi:hypothetical protein
MVSDNVPKMGEFLNSELVSLLPLPVHCGVVDAAVTYKSTTYERCMVPRRWIHIEREDTQLLLDCNLGILDLFFNEVW